MRLPIKLTLFVLISAFLSVGDLGAQIVRTLVPDSSFETVTIFYTANTRGLHAESQSDAPASAMLSVINALREKYKDSLLVDLGDFMGATPTTILTKGKSDFEIMGMLGYDLIHISNDEFITGSENLCKRISETRIPVLTGNLDVAGSKTLRWIIQPCGNRNIGFIGVTSSSFNSLVLANLRQGVVVESARDYIPGLSRR